jgi:hypothetical protein
VHAMPRLKPSGVRLSVWRILPDDTQDMSIARGGFSIRKSLGTPPSLRELAGMPQAAARRPAARRAHAVRRGRRTQLRGILEGWVKETRKTPSGREYSIYCDADGLQYHSRQAAERAALAASPAGSAATEHSPSGSASVTEFEDDDDLPLT